MINSLILSLLLLAVTDNVNLAKAYFPQNDHVVADTPYNADKSLTGQHSGSQGVFQSTSYCLTGSTATGTSAGYGQVAVDPNVIPLGSTLHISGYGNAVATDTGSAIRGNIVDVWLPCDEAIQWGRRQVEVTIIK